MLGGVEVYLTNGSRLGAEISRAGLHIQLLPGSMTGPCSAHMPNEKTGSSGC